jgi:hypothetical protein
MVFWFIQIGSDRRTLVHNICKDDTNFEKGWLVSVEKPYSRVEIKFEFSKESIMVAFVWIFWITAQEGIHLRVYGFVCMCYMLQGPDPSEIGCIPSPTVVYEEHIRRSVPEVQDRLSRPS